MFLTFIAKIRRVYAMARVAFELVSWTCEIEAILLVGHVTTIVATVTNAVILENERGGK